MPFENYVIIVAVAAMFYSLIARVVQNKLVDRKQMKQIQEESKQINKEMKEAQKSGDKARVDAAMKKQMDFLPKMNKVMFSQFKPMIVILIIFFAFNWAISSNDPSKNDDFLVAMNDAGKGCDSIASDGIYSSCFNMTGANSGKWVVTVSALRQGAEIGSNSTYFLHNIDNTTDTFLEQPKGEGIAVKTDKQVYYSGDQVIVTATPPSQATEVKATLNNGTSFYVDLPFTIPILNVQRLQQPYWWFIFVAVISGIVFSIIIGRLQKAGVIK